MSSDAPDEAVSGERSEYKQQLPSTASGVLPALLGASVGLNRVAR